MEAGEVFSILETQIGGEVRVRACREIGSILRQCRENPGQVAKIQAEPPLCFSVSRKADVDSEAVAYLAEEISKPSAGEGASSLLAAHSKSKRKWWIELGVVVHVIPALRSSRPAWSPL